MNLESLKVKGVVTIKRYDTSNKLFSEIVVNNLIVNTGLRFFIEKALDLDSSAISSIGIGNGYKTPELTDSALVRSQDQTNLNLTHTTFYKDIRYKAALSDKQLFVETTLGETEYGGNEVAEVGLFTDSDIMIARTILSPGDRFTKRLDDYVSISWKITFG